MGDTNYLANQSVSQEQLNAWVEQFHTDGYLFLKNVLTPEMVVQLRADLDEALAQYAENGKIIALHPRMFETSAANLALFDMEPIVSFAEALCGNSCHVVHNNSFKSFTGGGGITTWHQDDAPHYLVTHGEPPTNIRLPVLLFTANYYLTDVPDESYGPGQFIPGSHLFGAPCPPVMEGTKWEEKITSCLGPAGSVVLFNNQVWHRGGPNTSDRDRAITQVSYGRRMVNHFFYPFMNYQMPAHCYENANPRLKRLLGFLPTGAYG